MTASAVDDVMNDLSEVMADQREIDEAMKSGKYSYISLRLLVFPFQSFYLQTYITNCYHQIGAESLISPTDEEDIERELNQLEKEVALEAIPKEKKSLLDSLPSVPQQSPSLSRPTSTTVPASNTLGSPSSSPSRNRIKAPITATDTSSDEDEELRRLDEELNGKPITKTATPLREDNNNSNSTNSTKKTLAFA